MSLRLDAMFKTKPPLRPFDDLAAIVEDWKYRFAEGGIRAELRDTVVDYCAAASSLDEAIDRACDSRRPNGKMHNHQTRVRKKARDAYANFLKRDTALRNWKFHDFEPLIVICESNAPPGIGPVTVYDVATRIGAFLKLSPSRVYLHAHVTHGYRELLGYERTRALPKSVAVDALPKELHGLPPDEIEDFLCTYSTYFWKLRPQLEGQEK